MPPARGTRGTTPRSKAKAAAALVAEAGLNTPKRKKVLGGPPAASAPSSALRRSARNIAAVAGKLKCAMYVRCALFLLLICIFVLLLLLLFR